MEWAMRLFVGIPLANNLCDELAQVVAELRHGAKDLRWSPPEGWHITLQFLGNTSAETLECLKTQLDKVHSAAVPVRLGKLGSFERVGVVYVDVEPTPELQALQQRVKAATANCGLAAEERPFHPHITLARARGRGQLRGLPAPPSRHDNPSQFSPYEATEFLLYESFTDPSGARYEVRGHFALGD